MDYSTQQYVSMEIQGWHVGSCLYGCINVTYLNLYENYTTSESL